MATVAEGLAGANLIAVAGAIVLAVCFVTFRLGFAQDTRPLNLNVQ